MKALSTLPSKLQTSNKNLVDVLSEHTHTHIFIHLFIQKLYWARQGNVLGAGVVVNRSTKTPILFFF